VSKKYKKAIIVGADSGLGSELAKILSDENYILGLMARKLDKLKELDRDLPSKTLLRAIDITRDEAVDVFEYFMKEMEDIDLIVVNTVRGAETDDLDWYVQQKVIKNNVLGAAAVINSAYNYFQYRGGGQIVAISSITAIRGSRSAPAYAASKAFITQFMAGLRHKAAKEKVQGLVLTTVIPGYIQTPLVENQKPSFLVTMADRAAEEILHAIEKKKSVVYISTKWSIVGFFLKLIPEWLYHKF